MANITLSFGIFMIPAKTEGAIESRPDMKNMCVGQPEKGEHGATPVVAPRQCIYCGPITDSEALVKGIPQGGGTFTIVEQADVEEARDTYSKEYKKEIALVAHPAGPFLAATGPGDTMYYLTPKDAGGENHYRLLAELITNHPELAFVGLHTPRTATSLYQVTARDGVLVMEKRTRSQSLKPAPSVGGTLNNEHYQMLEGALQNFITPYDADEYEDGYINALATMADEGEQVSVDSGESKPRSQVVTVSDDVLMEKLRALQVVA